MNVNQNQSKELSLYLGISIEGHPDKIADQISDVILDAFLTRDPDARVACETVLTTVLCWWRGEFKTADRSVFEAVKWMPSVWYAKHCVKSASPAVRKGSIRMAAKSVLPLTTSRHVTKALIVRMANLVLLATRASCLATPVTKRRN